MSASVKLQPRRFAATPRASMSRACVKFGGFAFGFDGVIFGVLRSILSRRAPVKSASSNCAPRKAQCRKSARCAENFRRLASEKFAAAERAR
jgi:hypothetical protein